MGIAEIGKGEGHSHYMSEKCIFQRRKARLRERNHILKGLPWDVVRLSPYPGSAGVRFRVQTSLKQQLLYASTLSAATCAPKP